LHQFNCDSLGIVVIVSVTRGDLREEFNMANDVFALSPMSARATQPSEEDYDAISQAFMETARGRWFLGEYAKRNRNADTRMVLDAVERIEQSIAAQKIPEPEPVPDTSLADALAAIKAAMSEARAAAVVAVDDLALNQHLAPVRKGTRVIREISWRWREIGADSRICDLIDSQVSAIEASCAQISSADPHPGLQAAFALIDRSIAAFDENNEAGAGALAETSSSDESASDEMAAAAGAETMSSVGEAEAVASVDESLAETVSAETLSTETLAAETLAAETLAAETLAAETLAAETPFVETRSLEIEQSVATAVDDVGVEAVAEITPEAADADDEALLDMVAAEMGAPDLSDDSEYYNAALAETQAAETQAADAMLVEAQSETAISAPPRAATPLPSVRPLPPPSSERGPEPSLVSSPAPTPEPSLGSTLIANGFVTKPKPANDPLAALRRLSQVEKIALFS
jgi:hypothetical protein